MPGGNGSRNGAIVSGGRRKATHAGSWYKADAQELGENLDIWLSKAGPPTHGPARAIIAPHAGYFYCGECSAHAYKEVDPQRIKRVFILGPSHHVGLSVCALSPNASYQTPFYDLPIDQVVYKQLRQSGIEFETLTQRQDEEEHSLEMHLPYIARCMQRRAGEFTIVPILVGSLSASKEAEYGELFAPYLADPANLFVISSDFCHWGQRFRYTYCDSDCRAGNSQVWQSIERLDKQGMNCIEQLDAAGFSDYLQQFRNTICGRHPISVLLQTVRAMRRSLNGTYVAFRFLKYAQSSRCKSDTDSSVSYAAGTLVIG